MIRVASVILLLAMLLTAVSCAGTSPSTTVNGTTEGAVTTTPASTTAAATTAVMTTAPVTEDDPIPGVPMILIAESGTTAYKIIYPDEGDVSEVTASRTLKEALEDTAKIESVTRNTDFVRKGEDTSGEPYEILIGETNRPESAEILASLEGERFKIVYMNDKIVIVGTSPALTLLGVNTFISEYVKGEKVEVEEGMNREFTCSTDKNSFVYKEVVNPIYSVGNDPWVVRQGEDFYYCWSEGGIKVKKIENLDKITTEGGNVVWTPPPGTNYSHELWAPELHYVNGDWYIYVAADDGNNANHRMYVLKGTSQDPTRQFRFVGQITDPTDRWAIDGTVMKYKGELYFIWSGWEGYVDGAQNLYIAHMSDPTTIDSERVLISRGEYDWEKNGMPLNEGPVALVGDETALIIYSASGSWTDHYCLGQLTLIGDDPLDPDAWEKTPTPVFQAAAGAYGPGHCSFVEAYDGQLWMAYHANLLPGTGWSGRSCRAQPVEWDGKTLKLGRPATQKKTLLVPYYGYKVDSEIVEE